MFGMHYGAISISLSRKAKRDMACGYVAAYWKLVNGIVMDITGDHNVEMRSVAANINKTASDQASVNTYIVCLVTCTFSVHVLWIIHVFITLI